MDTGGLGPGEQPVPPAKWNGAQGPFQVVGVDRYLGIGEVYPEGAFTLPGIGQGRGQGTFGHQVRVVALLVDSGEEGIDQGFGVI